ncbi:MAG: PolC-type DNA polymerase III, partial [Oscillibacter sp.]|nr:PolC-type DNA polymerase III [Oscillibacter sp.]
MAKNIPFFDMFTELQLSSELRLKLVGAELTGAAIDQGAMSITMYLLVKTPLTQEDIKALQELICRVYTFRKVEIFVTCMEAERSPKAETAPPQGEKSSSVKAIMGNPIKAKPVSMSELNLKMGTACVCGKVFFYECQETRRPGTWRLTFDMTDYTNSVTVMKFLNTKEAQQIQGAIKPGMWLKVQGKMELTRDGK